MTDFTTDLDDDFIGQSGSGDGSYMLVKVPDHGTDTFYYKPTGSVTMTSFLRVGAVPSSDPTAEHGWDLAKLVVGFIDDTRKRDVDTDEATTTIASIVDGATGTSIDSDLQTRMKNFYGGGKATVDQTKRIGESKKLHYRGGWRDHSDGNRISTTLGDKVEIIRGNYKMVVLGRQQTVNEPVDSLANSVTTWDASGGHIHDWRFTPGAVTEISWVESIDEDGYSTWKVTEETVKGDVDETYHGIVNETYLGPSVTTTTGWVGGCNEDDGTRADDDASNEDIPKIYRENPTLNRENPIVWDQTWAKEIHDYDGSSDCYVGSIDEKTFASSMTEEIRVSGKIDSEIHASKVVEDVYVDYHSTTFHGVDKRELWMGHFGEMFLGAIESFKIGNFVDVRIAAKIIEANFSATEQVQFNFGWGFTALEIGFSKTDIFKGLMKNSFDLCTEVNEITPGATKAISVKHWRVALSLFLG